MEEKNANIIYKVGAKREDAPIPPERSPFESYEIILLRYIVRYGERILYDYVDEGTNERVLWHVADYVKEDLGRDNLTFYTPLYKRMLDEAAERCQEEGFVASRYFSAHPDPQVRQLSENLSSPVYQVSKYHSRYEEWKKREEEGPGDEELKQLVTREVMAFKEARTLYQLRDREEKLKEAQSHGDTESIHNLMEEITRLNEIKRAFCKVLGERIVIRL